MKSNATLTVCIPTGDVVAHLVPLPRSEKDYWNADNTPPDEEKQA